jgi:Fatty acid desaturase
MAFETKKEVLDWYEKQPRTLDQKFLGEIPWKDVKNHPLDKKLVPVLLYMRDVETLTDLYYSELRRTPTGKDPVISKFMERWGVEEVTHGEVLNRFLNEAGIETGETWKEQVRQAVSRFYHFNAYFITSLTNLVGTRFTATHMTYGAIHEMCTAQAYRRLMKLADHPVLTHILNGIIREESAHTQFYWSVARIELRQSPVAQKISRFIVDHFWNPVGQGSKPRKQTHYTIGTLFNGKEGLEWVDKTITRRVSELPGFSGITTINEVAAMINRNMTMNPETI